MIVSQADILAACGIATASAQESAILGFVHGACERLIRDHVGFTIDQRTFTEYYPTIVNRRVGDALVEGYEAVGNRALPVERYRVDERVIPLNNIPVRSVTSVYENRDAWLTAGGSFPDDTLVPAGDYKLDCDTAGLSRTGFLIRHTGPWTRQERCVKVTYVAGYTPTELTDDYPHFRLAVLQAVVANAAQMKMHAAAFRVGKGGAVVGEGIDSWSVTYDGATAGVNYGLAVKLPKSVLEMLESDMNYTRYL